MPHNEIVESKTVQVGPNGGVTAIMIAANVLDPSALASFVGEIVERFKVQRMISAPSTSHFLLTVRGDTTADALRALWLQYVARDPVLSVFMQQLQVADVVRAGRSGPALEQLSLLS